jgi:hypothetical protein
VLVELLIQRSCLANKRLFICQQFINCFNFCNLNLTCNWLMIFHGTLYGNKLYDGVEYQGYSTNQRIETQLWKTRPDLILKLSQNCLMWPYKGTVKYGHKRQMV